MDQFSSGLSPNVDLSLVLAFRLRPKFVLKSGLRPNRHHEVKLSLNYRLRPKFGLIL